MVIFSTDKIVCTGVKNEESVRVAILKLNQVIYKLKLTFKAPIEENYEEIYFL